RQAQRDGADPPIQMRMPVVILLAAQSDLDNELQGGAGRIETVSGPQSAPIERPIGQRKKLLSQFEARYRTGWCHQSVLQAAADGYIQVVDACGHDRIALRL